MNVPPLDVPRAFSELYPEIKRIAHVRLAQVGRSSQLCTTVLAHEGFLKLAERANLEHRSRAEFLCYVGKVLRSIVLDHLRSQGTGKHGGKAWMVTLSQAEAVAAPEASTCNLEQLDRVMLRLGELDSVLYQTLEMNAFTGIKCSEIAALRGVTERTVQRELVKARALVERLMAA